MADSKPNQVGLRTRLMADPAAIFEAQYHKKGCTFGAALFAAVRRNTTKSLAATQLRTLFLGPALRPAVEVRCAHTSAGPCPPPCRSPMRSPDLASRQSQRLKGLTGADDRIVLGALRLGECGSGSPREQAAGRYRLAGRSTRSRTSAEPQDPRSPA